MIKCETKVGRHFGSYFRPVAPNPCLEIVIQSAWVSRGHPICFQNFPRHFQRAASVQNLWFTWVVLGCAEGTAHQSSL